MSESVTVWIEKLKTGDKAVVHRLWLSYFEKLLRATKKFLAGTNQAVADEEDVALSAFASFCRRAADKGFAQLQNRNDLWQLLMIITRRKVYDLRKYHACSKRDTGMTESLSGGADLTLAGRIAAPDFVAEMAEEVNRLLGVLSSSELRQIAIWKMEGYSNADIASLRDCAERTIERKVWIIKQLWEPEIQQNG